ncbi:ImmA/IrrE family metallo-endopeptidase [Flammeovirga sp. SJP92]|uniref:ImmA/IrrE family metallo-endopeptidase n=1 Tax=Flammeovirga sp. SJP92 TaxID=1775430 RepID=UPI0007884A2A|nr:helix-turn-helix domain-containing protein [Flammeovirga sp. SJP92]KXX70610.1 hypothetical protein AVL50_07250 [Flammeovirga sp. SJP92]
MNEKEQERLLEQAYNVLFDSAPKGLIGRIRDYCEEFSISEERFCVILGITRPTLRRILENDAQKIDIFLVIKLSKVLNISTQQILQEYIDGLDIVKNNEIIQAEKRSFVASNFDLKELKKLGLIEQTKDLDKIILRLEEFFKIDSILSIKDYESILFSKAKLSPSETSFKIWKLCALKQAKFLSNPNPFDPQKVQAILPNIKKCIANPEKGLLAACVALWQLGITVIIQEYQPKSTVRGATFVRDNKPYIVLTNFQKRYDTIWFTLFHELYHSLYDFDTFLSTPYHITDPSQPDILFMEERADNWASEQILSDKLYQTAKTRINRKDFIEKLAFRLSIHPSIIYGRHLHFNSKDYKKFNLKNNYLIPSDIAVKNLKVHSLGMKYDIEKVVEPLKQVYNQY